MMQGEHTFELDCHYLSPYSCAFGMEIKVGYDVEVSWSDGVDQGKTTPSTVTLIIGGVEGDVMGFSELHGALASFVTTESKKLGLEQLGITDEQARDYLMQEEEARQFERDHAAGCV